MSPSSHSSFDGLGLAPRLREALARQHLHKPTPIQERAIPLALQGNDVVGIAQTGTGKTLAFGLPMIQRLAHVKGQGLILLPTRELALQVDEHLHAIGQDIGLRTAVLIGGAPVHPQINALKAQPHIVIATPGRLVDLLEQHVLELSRVAVLVLDEADRMLDMGFAPQLNKILARVPVDRQTMLFSATMPADIVRMATTHMRKPLRVEIAPEGTTAERVMQEIIIVKKEDKLRLLHHVLQASPGSVLVFSRTRHGARRLTRDLRSRDFRVAEIHADRSLTQRREALEGFRSGKYRILIATDIAARGIDVKGIELVVNYDLPDDAQDYVHRIGRTGRAGCAGRAISFATPEQRNDIRDIERIIRKSIPLGDVPDDLSPMSFPSSQHTTPQTVKQADSFVSSGQQATRQRRRYPRSRGGSRLPT